MHLGRVGLWTFQLDLQPASAARETVAELEELGYPTVWLPEAVGREPFVNSAMLLGATERMVVATGIASVWARDAMTMAAGHLSLNEAFGGRFLLGLGVSHQPMVDYVRGHQYDKPLSKMRSYLEAMDNAIYMAPRPAEEPRRVLAALGPKMLELAGAPRRSAPTRTSCPSSTPRSRGRCSATGRCSAPSRPSCSTPIPSGRGPPPASTWPPTSRCPTTPTTCGGSAGATTTSATAGSDKLVDAIVAWGDEAAIVARVQAHLDAGADHVCVQVLGSNATELPMEQWRRLAEPFERSDPPPLDLTRGSRSAGGGSEWREQRSTGWALILDACRHRWKGISLGVLAGLGWTAGKVSVGILVARAVDLGIESRTWPSSARGRSPSRSPRWSSASSPGSAATSPSGRPAGSRPTCASGSSPTSSASTSRSTTAPRPGQLMSRANTDLQQIQAFVVMIPLTISNGVTVLAVTVILFFTDPVLTVLALGSLPFLNVLATRFSRRLHPAVMGIQQESAELAAVVEETVAGVRVVKGFGAERVQAARLRVEADGVYDRSMEAAGVRATFLPALELLPNIGLIAVLGYGGHQVLNGNLSLGQLVGFNVYVVMLIWPLRMLGMIIAQGQRSAASAERVDEILVTAPGDPRQPQRAARCPREGPSGRPRRGALRGGAVRVRARAARWCSTASTSPCRPASPSRWWAPPAAARPPSPGSSRASTTSTRARCWSTASTCSTCACEKLRKAVGIVFEDTFLFSDSIASNIAFADPEASLESITRAARLAGAGGVHRGAARGLRDADRRAGLLAVGWPAPAPRHRPGDPRRPAGPDPRRRHLVGRPHQGARDPRRAHRGDARPHHDRDRPPAGHHRPGRPRRAARRRSGRRRRHPRVAPRVERGVPRGPRRRRGARARGGRGRRVDGEVAGVD